MIALRARRGVRQANRICAAQQEPGHHATVPLCRCLDALVTMGVLIPGPDMTAVRRTAQFFLNNFQERLAQQRAEAAANPEYNSTFKGELSKEEKQAKRKQILSSIGAQTFMIPSVARSSCCFAFKSRC